MGRVRLDKKSIVDYCQKAEAFFLYLLIFALPFSKAVIEISASFLIVAWVLKRALRYKPDGQRHPIYNLFARFRPIPTYLNIPIYLYIAAGFFSVIFSSNFHLSLSNFGSKIMEYIMLYFIVAEFISDITRLKKVLIVAFTSLIMVAIDCLFQYLFGYDLLRLWPLEAGRVTGSFQMPGDLGGYLGPFLCLSLALSVVRFKERKSRYTLRILSVLLLTLLIGTFSRGAWLGFLVGVGFLGLTENRKIIYFTMAILIALAVVLPHIIDAPYDILARAKSSFKLSGLSNSDRKLMWQVAWQMIKDRPFFGQGFSTFMGNFAKYGQEYRFFKEQGQIPYAHNCYLQIAAETGIVGLISFLFLIGTFLWRSLASLRKMKKRFSHAVLSGITAGIIATLTHSTFDTNLYSLQLSVLFWFMLSINAGLQRGLDLDRS